MKIIFSFIFSLTSLTTIFGQAKIHIQNQKNYKYSDAFILDSLGIGKPDFDTTDLEIRISIWNSASGIHKKFILDRQKNGHWQGKSFEYYYYNDTHYNYGLTTANKLTLEKEWDIAFTTIVDKDYINLPGQNQVENDISATNKDSKNKSIMVVADGTSYTYEFLTKKHKRKFRFKNPDSYFKFNSEQHNDTRYFAMYIDLLSITKRALDFEPSLKVHDK